MFVFGNIPVVRAATPFKYWTSVIIGAFSIYKFLVYRNNQHYEQIFTPYFEKYSVK